jgi:hypothetical protein
MQILSIDTLKTIGQGSLGALTFGIYYQYTTNKMIELNNQKIELQNKYFIDKMENQYKKQMTEMENKYKLLNEKLEKLNKI